MQIRAELHQQLQLAWRMPIMYQPVRMCRTAELHHQLQLAGRMPIMLQPVRMLIITAPRRFPCHAAPHRAPRDERHELVLDDVQLGAVRGLADFRCRDGQ